MEQETKEVILALVAAIEKLTGLVDDLYLGHLKLGHDVRVLSAYQNIELAEHMMEKYDPKMITEFKENAKKCEDEGSIYRGDVEWEPQDE
jgi:hypothetical protein